MTTRRVQLGDVCSVGRGSSPRPIKDEKFFTGGTIPWVKIADATASGKHIFTTGMCVNEYGAVEAGLKLTSKQGEFRSKTDRGVQPILQDF
jgi:hypothetical protein